MSSWRLYIITFFFIFCFQFSYCQDSLKADVHCPSCDKNLRKFLEDWKTQPTRDVEDLLFKLRLMGYLEAALDTVQISARKEAHLQPGDRYKWEQLTIYNAPADILEQMDRKRFAAGRSFEYEKILRAISKILRRSENQGYPFARLQFDSVAFAGQKVFARLRYEPGPEITFDTLKIHGTDKINPGFLSAFLNIAPGNPYDQSKVDQIPAKLKNLPFLQLDDEPQPTFQNEAAIVRLYVNHTPASRFEGIIGFAPNESAGGKLLVTGQVDLGLNNLFNSAKMLKLRWQRLKAASQYLDLDYYHPNLLRSPIHFSLVFNLLKEDSAYLDRNFAIKAGYDINPRLNVNFVTNYNSAHILNAPEAAIDNQLGDYRWISYGAELNWQNLDRLILPTKGTRAHIEGLIGDKNIFSEEIKFLQLRSRLSFSGYFPLNDRLILHNQLSAGIIHSDRLFVSDLFRLGGANDLRGFTENELFASHFTLLNVELRYFFEPQSYLMAVVDQAYARNDAAQITDYPTGAGVGITLKAGPGILKLIYAVGRTSQQPFSLNRSKLHFGFESLF